jgi:adenine-specific DNA methylase
VPSSSPEKAHRQKRLGAFYTPAGMAALLVDWAVRAYDDRVLDPSFGGLVFLEAAARRLEALGATASDARAHLYGADLDEDAHASAAAHSYLQLPASNLVHGDFFSLAPGDRLPICDAVIGTPPYIRYQGWDSSFARRLSEEAGVSLTRLSSSWAPFVVHSTAFVAPGGRLSMVLPAEMLHAQYANAVVEFLGRSFRRVRLAVFEERVFPGALEEVVLLFADAKDEGPSQAGIELIECRTLDDLNARVLDESPAPQRPARNGRSKLLAQLLPEETHALYEDLGQSAARLGDIASVDIGAVTGANDFFLVDRSDAGTLPAELLSPAVSKAAHLRGARTSEADMSALAEAGQRVWMFTAPKDPPKELLEACSAYLDKGRQAKVHEHYKCRVRDPWWSVPIPKRGAPDLFMTYFSNETPRVVVNEVGALHTNTIHSVNMQRGFGKSARAVAAGFMNSLTLLSAELVGRSYGGGVLKLEPTEAESLLIPPLDGVEELLPFVDARLREGDVKTAVDVVDLVVLGRNLGLSAEDRGRLRTGAAKLRQRRRARGKGKR